MFRPDWLHQAEPIVCPAGTILELTDASPAPGELVVQAECAGEGIHYDVTAKLLLTVNGAVFVPGLLLGTLIMWSRGWTRAISAGSVRPAARTPSGRGGRGGRE
jgi:hypothetical protein